MIKKVTIRQYYRHRILTTNRDDDISILHNSGKLFQQYIMGGWVRAKSNDLLYLRQCQKTYRFASARAVRNYLRERAIREKIPIGKMWIPPASHPGSTRYQNRRYLDAMAIVAHGKPDLFVTMTCNPRWLEICDNLEYQQKYENRPDLVASVP